MEDTIASCSDNVFQSTLPMRGATQMRLEDAISAGISIHAPHAGSDAPRRARFHAPSNFNPRSPCGERQIYRRGGGRISTYFTPRSPCGERPRRWRTVHADIYFNPRSPCGERRWQKKGAQANGAVISTPRLPMRGATAKSNHFSQRIYTIYLICTYSSNHLQFSVPTLRTF